MNGVIEDLLRSRKSRAWLRGELLRRAAVSFERARAWVEAAQCWERLGETKRAAELYQRTNDPHRAASALLDAGVYEEAARLYRTLLNRPLVRRVAALLGLAACHRLAVAAGQQTADLSITAAKAAYREARGQLQTSRLASDWEALAEYGARLGRYDLIQEGYERALEILPDDQQRVAVTRAYLAAVRRRGDRLLARALEERLAGWGVTSEEVDAQAPRRTESSAFDAIEVKSLDDVERLLTEIERLRARHPNNQRVEERAVSVVGDVIPFLGNLCQQLTHQMDALPDVVGGLSTYQTGLLDGPDVMRDFLEKFQKLRSLTGQCLPLVNNDERRRTVLDLADNLDKKMEACRSIEAGAVDRLQST